MIQVAYDVAPYQVSGGPDWLDKDGMGRHRQSRRFSAEIPFEQLRPMLRELIRDRFQLKLRAGKQDLPYFALVVDKKGSKLKPSTSSVTNFHLERGLVLSWDEGIHAILCLVAGTMDTGEQSRIGRNGIARGI
jgi:uncharacterized protein (TIGR03435 family)